jgi:hypothetical protein
MNAHGHSIGLINIGYLLCCADSSAWSVLPGYQRSVANRSYEVPIIVKASEIHQIALAGRRGLLHKGTADANLVRTLYCSSGLQIPIVGRGRLSTLGTQ